MHLDRALEMEHDEQEDWLAALRAEDVDLAAQLQKLLDESQQLKSEGFLETEPVRPLLSELLPGKAVGAYTLESPVGRGGMGSVWLARRNDGRSDARVAIKILNTDLLGDVAEERFRREGSFLARLSHPNVARLIDAGVSAEGRPYLVLEHVDGSQIDRYCDGRSLGVKERLRLFLGVLDAVAHAHAHMIVHRDIKPANVLVTCDGRVKLLDFGIGKLLEPNPDSGATALTKGGRAFTPEYAAPEQIVGGPITTATDIFALGVLLYELLCGRHPAGDARRVPAKLLQCILEDEPQRLSDAVVDATLPAAERFGEALSRSSTPGRLRKLLKGDLDMIAVKALRKAPEDRYPSADALADDLRRYLACEPVSARPCSRAYRAGLFVRRRRVALALGAALLLVFCALAGAYLLSADPQPEQPLGAPAGAGPTRAGRGGSGRGPGHRSDGLRVAVSSARPPDTAGPELG